MTDYGAKPRMDYRARLYECYVTQQMQTDIPSLRRHLDASQPALRGVIDQHFPSNRQAVILDIGCGYGLLLHLLRKAGYANLIGVETSAEQVKAAQELGLDCVKQGDLIDFLRSGAKSSFDVIVAFDVLEHLTKDELLDVLELIYSSLKPEGRLILHVPNGEAIFSGKIVFGDFTHQTAFTAKSVHQVASFAGFSQIDCYEDKPVVHGVFSFVRAMIWGVVRTWYRFLNAAETGDLGSELILSQNLLAVCRKAQ